MTIRRAVDRLTQPLTLTVEQAAAVLGVARSTAYELVRAGEIESLRLRRRIVVPVAHLAERLGVTAEEVWAAVQSRSSGPPSQLHSRSPSAEERAEAMAKQRESTQIWTFSNDPAWKTR